MSLYAVFGDVHGPFESKENVELLLDVIEDLGADIVLNGDILDFYSINSYGPKHPDVRSSLDDEFYWGETFLRDLRKRFPDREIIWCLGNHEFRLERFVLKHCPAFYNYLLLHKMLPVDELDIKLVQYNERYQLANSLFVQHSPPSYSENLANTSFKKKLDEDHIWNCSHRADSVVKTGSSGRIYTTYVNGWFGSKGIIHELQRSMPENRRVFSFTKNHEMWNCSFCLVGVDEHGEHFIQQIIIKDNKCVVGGTLYSR